MGPLNGGHGVWFTTESQPPTSTVRAAGDALTRQAQAMVGSVMDEQLHKLASADESWQTLTLCQLIEQRLKRVS